MVDKIREFYRRPGSQKPSAVAMDIYTLVILIN